MIKITGIKKLKRLYRVDLDGTEQEKIYVTDDTIIKFFLTLDKSLTENELEEVINFDQFAQGKSLAIYYISFKQRTAAEVKKYLREHEIIENQIEEILENLSQNNLINDEAYAENFIQGKISLATAGPYQIKQKLHLKGIENHIIDTALAEHYNDEAQIDVAYKLAEKQVRTSAHRLTLNQLKQKIIQTLMNKGFNYSIANIALENLVLEADEDNELDLLYNELDKVARRYSRNYDGYERNQKITQSLARKGFDFDSIRSALRDYKFED
jgi:regulatory protein